MDQGLILENEGKLRAEKKRLETLLQHFAHRKQTEKEDFQSNFPNLGDSTDENALEVTLYETNLAEEKSLEQRLEKVNAALNNIAQGTYGLCAVGGEPIEEARLRVAPEADTCVKHSS